jgi:hypothetical protein
VTVDPLACRTERVLAVTVDPLACRTAVRPATVAGHAATRFAAPSFY